jgi:hypothetical protein
LFKVAKVSKLLAFVPFQMEDISGSSGSGFFGGINISLFRHFNPSGAKFYPVQARVARTKVRL